MSTPDPAHERDASGAAPDVRVLRLLLLVGSIALALVWLIEGRAGVLADWDRWLYPVMLAAFAGSAAWLHAQPGRTGAARLLACATLNGYLVLALHLVLFVDSRPIDLYAMSTTVFWMPLGYASAFVFLSLRSAIALSGLAFVASFAPIGLVLALGAPARWGPDFAALMGNVVLSQATFIGVLVAIARLRAGYYRAEERVHLMQALAGTDSLTGLPNRRALSDALERHLALARRDGQPLTLMLLDVDHFKRVNDHYGHAAGDEVLRALAQLLRTLARASDLVGRWGGEEFLVIAPHAALPAAHELAERIRAQVAGHAFAHGDPVTLSLGLTQALPGDMPDALLQRADRALYRAKQRGRNRIETEAFAAAS